MALRNARCLLLPKLSGATAIWPSRICYVSAMQHVYCQPAERVRHALFRVTSYLGGQYVEAAQVNSC